MQTSLISSGLIMGLMLQQCSLKYIFLLKYVYYFKNHLLIIIMAVVWLNTRPSLHFGTCTCTHLIVLLLMVYMFSMCVHNVTVNIGHTGINCNRKQATGQTSNTQPYISNTDIASSYIKLILSGVDNNVDKSLSY